MDFRQKLKLATQLAHSAWDPKRKKRGYGIFSVFVAIAIGLTIVGIMLAINAYVLSSIYDELPAAGTGQEIINDTLTAATTAASWLNIYTIVAIAAAIMALIFGFAAMGTRRSGR